jgi:hypothetical protein
LVALPGKQSGKCPRKPRLHLELQTRTLLIAFHLVSANITSDGVVELLMKSETVLRITAISGWLYVGESDGSSEFAHTISDKHKFNMSEETELFSDV